MDMLKDFDPIGVSGTDGWKKFVGFLVLVGVVNGFLTSGSQKTPFKQINDIGSKVGSMVLGFLPDAK